MEANEYFAKQIKQLRIANSYTIRSLAEKLGVKTSRVSMWECEGCIPHMDLLLKISHLFDVSINDLLEPKTNRIQKKIGRKVHGFSKTNIKNASLLAFKGRMR